LCYYNIVYKTSSWKLEYTSFKKEHDLSNLKLK
jgi:hypothetical protein